MYSLSKTQVALIESDVENARITLSHLSQELIDHICCEVESLMENGKTFEEAYALMKEQAGIQVLQKIQENTLYLTDKNYALMKTTLKITGNISLAMLGIGTLMKIFHWPGAGITLLLGFALLCLFFFPSAIYLNYKEGRTKGKAVLNLSILLGGIAFMAGILFKVMHWPGAGMMLFTGWCLILLVFLPALLIVKLKEASSGKERALYLLGTVAIMIFEIATMFKFFHWPGAAVLMITGSVLFVSFFLPMYTWQRFRETGTITGQYIFLVILSMHAIVLTALLTIKVSSPVLANFVKEESESGKIVQYFEQKKSRHLSFGLVSDSTRPRSALTELPAEADRLKALIMEIKLDLVQAAEQTDRQTALRYIENPGLINQKDNIDQVNALLMVHNGKSAASSLREALDAFREKACAATAANPELSRRIAAFLDTSAKGPHAGTWEEANFGNHMLIGALAFLTHTEKNVRMAESAAMQHHRTQKL